MTSPAATPTLYPYLGRPDAQQVEDLAWGEDYRLAARQALVELLEDRMAETIDRHLERMAVRRHADRRNGCYRPCSLLRRSSGFPRGAAGDRARISAIRIISP
jgi:hypothetical protein